MKTKNFKNFKKKEKKTKNFKNFKKQFKKVYFGRDEECATNSSIHAVKRTAKHYSSRVNTMPCLPLLIERNEKDFKIRLSIQKFSYEN